MVKYFILIKRKGTKKWMGAIPTRSGMSKTAVQKAARTQVRPNFSYKVISETQLKAAFGSMMRKTRRKKR